MKNVTERRRHLRAPLSLTAVIKTPQGSFEGKTADISVGGLAVILFLEKPEIGDNFETNLKSTEIHEVVLTCEKIWEGRIISKDKVYNAHGVEFIKISSGDRKIIASFVEEYYLV